MTTTIRTVFAAALLTLFASTAAVAEDVKVPETAVDHEAMAKKYRDEAGQYRKNAEGHRQMAAAYAKLQPGGNRNPGIAKMRKHCQSLGKGAEKLATDAEKAAEFHTMRGKEMQGK